MSEPLSSKRGLPLRVKMRHSSHFVDELAARHETAVGRMVPLSSLVPNPRQPRTEIGELSDLVASIREKGVLEPILIRPLPGGNAANEGGAKAGRYSIIAGERRYRAALEAGLFEVPAIELDVTEEEALEIALIENLQRKDLSAFEEAEGYRALGELHGYTQEQIGKAVGKARSTIAESLSLLVIPDDLRERARALGLQSRSALLEIAKIGEPQAMRELLEQAGRLGLGRDDLRKAGRREAAKKKGDRGGRKKPYTFKFRAPDKRFSLQLSFRQSTVEREDLIRALKQILSELQSAKG
ncbi:MAG: ParB/RepB/Spo0J family partition protein [Candidatus Binatia bacterium]